jgi:hypothetical protein
MSFVLRIASAVVVMTLAYGIVEAAPKKSKNVASSTTADITWLKEYFAGLDGETETTTATGDTVTVDALVPSQHTMYDLLNNLKGYARPGSFSIRHSKPDAKGEFPLVVSMTIDSDRIENAADFNKLFSKMQVQMQYVFECDNKHKLCGYNAEDFTTVANNYWLDKLEGKPGEIESLNEKGFEVMPLASKLMIIAIEERGKLESLFYFNYGDGELNAKGIAFLKKYFPASPIAYKGIIHFAHETGWEPK